MKLVLFALLIIFVSCEERYEEERDLIFKGTWRLIYSEIAGKVVYTDTALTDSKKVKGDAKFFITDKYQGNDLLLFYSRGYYDSSFFYRIQDDDLFVSRIMDYIKVIEYCPLDGDKPVIGKMRYAPENEWDSIKVKLARKEIMIIDTLEKVDRPLNPVKNSPERYYGTLSFDKEMSTLTIYRYSVDSDEQTASNRQYGKDIYKRPS
ncbi:MAG: hypothetical protein LBC68_05525 [Prevotellaceae bacterium]|nr:hypothetical protein [Prevotellaceae bacterium]